MVTESKGVTAAYLAFPTFLAAIEALEAGLPDTIDRSIWSQVQPATQYEIYRAFRFFELVDEEGRVLPTLRAIVTEPASRPSTLKGVFERCYSEVVGLALNQGSQRQLEQAMEHLGVRGATVRKAISFYVNAAEYSGLPLSPHWPVGKRRRGTGGVGARRRTPASAGKARGITVVAATDAPGTTRSIALASGGTVSLTANVDLITLSVEDRAWVIDLIDKFRSYAPEGVGQPS